MGGGGVRRDSGRRWREEGQWEEVEWGGILGEGGVHGRGGGRRWSGEGEEVKWEGQWVEMEWERAVGDGVHGEEGTRGNEVGGAVAWEEMEWEGQWEEMELGGGGVEGAV